MGKAKLQFLQFKSLGTTPTRIGQAAYIAEDDYDKLQQLIAVLQQSKNIWKLCHRHVRSSASASNLQKWVKAAENLCGELENSALKSTHLRSSNPLRLDR